MKSRLQHDGARLTRRDLRPEFADMAISATTRAHFRPGAQLHVDEAKYGYIEEDDGRNYNRIFGQKP